MDCITIEVARGMPLSHILMLYYILIEQVTQHISQEKQSDLGLMVCYGIPGNFYRDDII